MKLSPIIQETLGRLAPLIGQWTGRGRGGFPTLEGFDYAETLGVYRDQDAPYLTYEQRTELVDPQGRSIRKSHWEAGVLRPLEDGSIELACVQGSGRVEVLRGKLLAQASQPGRFSLHFESTLIGNDERVKSSSREWKLSGDHFTYVMKMATTDVGELTGHLEGSLIKTTFTIEPIGVIRSQLVHLEAAPRQGDEGAPEAWLELIAPVARGLAGITAGDELIVLTWLHLARRDVLQVHPRDRLDVPLTGVFATRSPERPNPVGLHQVSVLEVHGHSLRVAPMEAVDGTPIVDIKPVLGRLDER